jgi:hypothetical protein
MLPGHELCVLFLESGLLSRMVGSDAGLASVVAHSRNGFVGLGSHSKIRRVTVAHSRNVRAGFPVISATEEVTKAGWPIPADQASSNIFTTDAGMIVANSRRASSGDISSMRNERPMARPIVDTWSNWLRD